MVDTPKMLSRFHGNWGAALSALIVLFWGFFIVAHIVNGELAPQPLDLADSIALAMMGVWLVGLVVAWKWELVGGAVVLTAVLVSAVINWRVLTFPGTLIPIAALLFMSCALMSRAGQPATETRAG